MAYLKKTTGQQDGQQETSTVLGGGGVLGAGATPAGTAAAPDTAPTERAPSTPQYVPGERYLEGNRTGAQKLAEQIVNPIKQQATSLEESAKAKALETIGQAQVGGVDAGLITKAGQDARALQEQERQQIQDVLAGVYSGPTGIDFTAEQNDIGRLGEQTERLKTSSGLEQELSRMGTAGDRKYTAGMKAFDAMLMRQDPALREQLAAQAGLGERVTGTIEEQRQAALNAIAQGQATTAQRAEQVGNYFGNVASGQEQAWTDELARLRGLAGDVGSRLKNEQTLSAEQLAMIGLTPEAYDQMRRGYVATSYARERPLTYDENYNYVLNSPTQFTAPDAYAANAWKMFQLDPYATAVNPNQIGYSNVVDAESLAKYQALNALLGTQGAGYVPQAAGTGDLTENALNFNNVAAQQALAAFMKSGVAAPRSNLDYMEGVFGPGGYQGLTGTATGAPLYTTSGPGVVGYNPETGKGAQTFEYVGPMLNSGWWPVAQYPYDFSLYNYNTPTNQALANEWAKTSGYSSGGAPITYGWDTTYTPE